MTSSGGGGLQPRFRTLLDGVTLDPPPTDLRGIYGPVRPVPLGPRNDSGEGDPKEFSIVQWGARPGLTAGRDGGAVGKGGRGCGQGWAELREHCHSIRV